MIAGDCLGVIGLLSLFLILFLICADIQESALVLVSKLQEDAPCLHLKIVLCLKWCLFWVHVLSLSFLGL